MFLVLGACATGVPSREVPDAGRPPGGDAGGDPSRDGAPVDPPDAAVDAPPHFASAALAITEVVLAPTGGELIELTNPTDDIIDLSTYYLTDGGGYFQLPAGTAAADSSDFIVRFPDGATLAPGAVITVAIDTAAAFQTTYGVAPTFSIASGTMVAVSTTGTPTLTNAGEPVVLFQWDGQGDLVRDVDLVVVGVPSSGNQLADKSGQAIDGPDADTTPSTYATDARTIAAQPSAPGAGASTKRIVFETGHELQAGTGNGITGDDETTEDTSQTWDTAFTAPTPGTLPAGLLP